MEVYDWQRLYMPQRWVLTRVYWPIIYMRLWFYRCKPARFLVVLLQAIVHSMLSPYIDLRNVSPLTFIAVKRSPFYLL